MTKAYLEAYTDCDAQPEYKVKAQSAEESPEKEIITENALTFTQYSNQPGLPEVEDCSSSVIPDVVETEEGTRKVIVSDPVSMTKYLFDNYRLSLYSYLNKCRRDGTLSKMIGMEVLNKVFNREAVNFTEVKYWRIDRENFYTDVAVELKIMSAYGPFTWNGFIEIWCSFEGDFSISIDDLCESVDRKGFDPLSPFLVPYFTNKRVDEVAEELWREHIPKALSDPKERDAKKLAKSMGLEVKHYDIYEHEGVKGIIFFAEDDLLVGEDRFEYDENGNKQSIKACKPDKKRIPANTIVINTNKIKKDYSEFHIFHECVHNEFHYLFFRLQRMGNSDPRRMKTKEIIIGKDEEVKDEMYFMEKQANRGAYGLMTPATDTRERILAECGKVKIYRHFGEKFEKAGKALGIALHLPHFHVRARMIQLGFIEAKGSLNYAERRLIRPFAFNIDSWRESEHTYVVERSAVMDICRSDDTLNKIMENGDYIYAEGHVVRNEPKFVKKKGNDYILTDLANAHVDDCCLRFVRRYKQENIGQFVYDRMYFDADYLKQTQFYLSDIMNQAQLDELEAKRKYRAEFPDNFREAVKMLLKKNKISIERLSEILLMDRVTLSRWLDEPKRYRNEDFLTLLSLIFKLPDWISALLFKRAHYQLDEDDKRHCAIQHILRVQSEDGIEAANEYLTKNNLAPLSVEGIE